MKRLLLIILCSLIMLPGVFAQDSGEEKKGYINLSMGPSIPLGSFGSTDLSDDNSGYANVGFNLQLINFGYKFSKHLGMAVMWSGSSFNIDKDAVLANSGLETAFSVDATPYSYGSILAGVLVSMPQGDFEFDFRGLIGLGYGISPEIKYNGYDLQGEYAILKQDKSESFALAYDLGIGTRYNVSDLINLNLFVDYMGFKPEFSVDLYGNKTLIGTSKFDQPMNHLTITLGFGFRLN